MASSKLVKIQGNSPSKALTMQNRAKVDNRMTTFGDELNARSYKRMK